MLGLDGKLSLGVGDGIGLVAAVADDGSDNRLALGIDHDARQNLDRLLCRRQGAYG